MATVASSAPVIPRSRPVTGWARLPIWLRRTILLVAADRHLAALRQPEQRQRTPLRLAGGDGEGVLERLDGRHALAGDLDDAADPVRGDRDRDRRRGGPDLFATVSTIGDDLLTLLSSILNPLPGVAVLPLAMLWFGLTTNAILFVIANATIWPLALAVTTGFKTANPTILAVGRNIGLSRLRARHRRPRPGRAPACDHRPEDRLGVRLAHGDRRRARLRGRRREGRPRLLHQQREALSPDPAGVRGPGHDRHPRSHLRVALRRLAEADGRALGDAVLMTTRRRDVEKDHARRVAGLAVLAAVAIAATVATAGPKATAPDHLTIAYQPGIGYTPLIVMKSEKTLEKQYPGLKIDWKVLSSGAAITNGVIAGDIEHRRRRRRPDDPRLGARGELEVPRTARLGRPLADGEGPEHQDDRRPQGQAHRNARPDLDPGRRPEEDGAGQARRRHGARLRRSSRWTTRPRCRRCSRARSTRT